MYVSYLPKKRSKFLFLITYCAVQATYDIDIWSLLNKRAADQIYVSLICPRFMPTNLRKNSNQSEEPIFCRGEGRTQNLNRKKMLHRHALMCLTFIHHLMVKTHRHFNNIQPSEAPAHAETQAYSLTDFWSVVIVESKPMAIEVHVSGQSSP